MTPEQKAQLEQALQDIAEIKRNLFTLDGSLEFKNIVKEYASESIKNLEVSSKGVDTEDQAVDEGGSATYNVLKEPDGFLEITIKGTTYHLPYYG